MVIRLEPDDLDGIWTLSFGRFGWKEYESRGAVVRIEHGQMFGGGSNFVYRGTCTLDDAAVTIHLDVDRYRPDPNFTTITGLQGDHFEFDCVADAISRDHFEGRVNNPRISEVLPELRLALVRFAPL
jgi:hypothetical protein